MKIYFKCDGIITNGYVSKISLFRTLFSIFLHFNNPEEWTYLKVTKIAYKKYSDWKYMYIPIQYVFWDKNLKSY